MSRSYKHNPRIVIGCKSLKKNANRRVRHYKELGQYSFYKRVFNSYDIRDYVFYSKDTMKNLKELREICKIVKGIRKGRLNASDYDFQYLFERFNKTCRSLDYLMK